MIDLVALALAVLVAVIVDPTLVVAVKLALKW